MLSLLLAIFISISSSPLSSSSSTLSELSSLESSLLCLRFNYFLLFVFYYFCFLFGDFLYRDFIIFELSIVASYAAYSSSDQLNALSFKISSIYVSSTSFFELSFKNVLCASEITSYTFNTYPIVLSILPFFFSLSIKET